MISGGPFQLNYSINECETRSISLVQTILSSGHRSLIQMNVRRHCLQAVNWMLALQGSSHLSSVREDYLKVKSMHNWFNTSVKLASQWQ